MGLLLFIWVLVRLFKMARGVLNTDSVKNDDFGSGLTVGFLAGYVGLLVQSISMNTVIVIRVMEPFWFMAAIVLSLPRLIEKEEAREDL